MNTTNTKITQSKANGQPCAWFDAGQVCFFDGRMTHEILHVNDVPITLEGAARHNVQNVLAAICVARAIGIDNEAISKGLAEFQGDPKDNPGRMNEFQINGARVFVDFAHNPHSIAAVIETVAEMAAKRRFVMLSMAGDRSDDAIYAVTQSALTLKPDYIVSAELEDYLRGRKLGDVSDIIIRICRDQGMSAEQLIPVSSPAVGAEKIIAMLKPGDLALLLVLDEREEIFDLLRNGSL